MSPVGRTLTSASSPRLTFHITFLTGDIRQIAEVNMAPGGEHTESGAGCLSSVSEDEAEQLLQTKPCVCNVRPTTTRQKRAITGADITAMFNPFTLTELISLWRWAVSFIKATVKLCCCQWVLSAGCTTRWSFTNSSLRNQEQIFLLVHKMSETPILRGFTWIFVAFYSCKLPSEWPVTQLSTVSYLQELTCWNISLCLCLVRLT